MASDNSRQKVRVRVRVRRGPSLTVKLVSSVLIAGALASAYWMLSQKPQRTGEATELTLSAEQHYSSERSVVLPADDSVHAAPTERWSYRGLLQDQDGRRYSLQLGVMLSEAGLRQTRFYLNLQDLQSGQVYSRQQQVAGLASQTTSEGFSFLHESWQIGGEGARHLLTYQDQSLRFELHPEDANAPLIPHTNGPYAGMLQGENTTRVHLYSRPEMATTGTLTLDGRPLQLRGTLWFDHLWGNIDSASMGWRWLNLNLGAAQGQIQMFEVTSATGQPLLGFANWHRGQQISPWNAEQIRFSTQTQPWTLELPGRTLQLRGTPPKALDAPLTGLGQEQSGQLQVSGDFSGEGQFEIHTPLGPTARGLPSRP